MKIKKGFTLFELLVVISIIAIISAVAVASFASAQKRARDAKRKEDVQAVSKALEQYYSVEALYPEDCTPGSEYLPGGLPADPKGGDYEGYSWQCTTDTYCICAKLEVEDSGNAYQKGTEELGIVSCSYELLDEETKDYYCIQNQQ